MSRGRLYDDKKWIKKIDSRDKKLYNRFMYLSSDICLLIDNTEQVTPIACSVPLFKTSLLKIKNRINATGLNSAKSLEASGAFFSKQQGVYIPWNTGTDVQNTLTNNGNICSMIIEHVQNVNQTSISPRTEKSCSFVPFRS